MLDTAIIGGGLSGLALARSLHRQGLSFALFEARPRLGGRVLTVACEKSGLAVDLGPTWFWPPTQPLITRLVAELGLEDFAQHEEGSLLYLREADKTPSATDGTGVHNGARRVTGGIAALIDAIAKELPADSLHLQHVLRKVHDHGDHVALSFSIGDRALEIRAKYVVLALPPRLVDEHIAFEPALDASTHEAMREAATWMAAQAKVVTTYEKPFWREAGQSGNAFVTHEQAVVGEIFDACDAVATQGALGGFLAFSPELRESFSAGLPILMQSQMVQVFGTPLDVAEQHYKQHYQDWATEPYTCSSADRSAPATEHTGVANPLLRRALWGGKLYLAGSETAAYGAGYLEGALEAAKRMETILGTGAVFTSDSTDANAASLAQFSKWVTTQIDVAFDDYHHRLHQSLATQQRDQLTQRAMLGAIEDVYNRALGVLDGLPFDMSGVAVERGRSALTPQVQQPFGDFLQRLLDDVIAFNRTSCALSNFPGEHKLSKEYVQTILRDVAAAWKEFSLSANALLLAKAENVKGARPDGGASAELRP